LPILEALRTYCCSGLVGPAQHAAHEVPEGVRAQGGAALTAIVAIGICPAYGFVLSPARLALFPGSVYVRGAHTAESNFQNGRRRPGLVGTGRAFVRMHLPLPAGAIPGRRLPAPQRLFRYYRV